MASFDLSFFTVLTVTLLVNQIATSSELKREVRSYSEITTTTMPLENENEEKRNFEKSANENKETYDMADTMKSNEETNVELVSRIFDTSPSTLTKFMAVNSNPNEKNRYVTAVTDDSNTHKETQEAVEESRLREPSVSGEDVVKDVKRNEGKENYESGRRCAENTRGGKDCGNLCKMEALKNIPTREKLSSIPERGARSSRNSSTGIISVNDTDDNISKILEESDTARITVNDFSTLNQMEVAARLLDDPTPLKTQGETEKAEMKDNENLEHPIQPITISFHKKLMPYMTDSPQLMESTEVTTTVQNDLLREEIQNDTVTSNAEKLITAENENKKDPTQRKENVESAATMKFVESHKVNKTMENSLNNSVNISPVKSNFQNTKASQASQAPQVRLYTDKEENEDYLKKTKDRWINIIINNYPPHVCNNEKM